MAVANLQQQLLQQRPFQTILLIVVLFIQMAVPPASIGFHLDTDIQIQKFLFFFVPFFVIERI